MYSQFYPSIGGLENVISILAHEFVREGQEVKVVTPTPPKDVPDAKIFPFEVIRRPLPHKFLHLTRWCDIFFQGNISLKGIWPLLLDRKPLMVTHQSWYQRLDGSLGWQDYVKQFIARLAINICASNALAERLQSKSTVIPNPYREDIFYEIPEITRDKELVFLGRLVSDKGTDILLEAMAKLKALEITPKLTVIGIGPEEAKLRQQANRLEIDERVDFVGAKEGIELVKLLNVHQILVVPSRWQEPFGIVALEGIACGCIVVGSEGGGLKEAIGPCGPTFPNGDVEALTQTLVELLTNPSKLSTYRANSASHLSRHTSRAVAKAYLEMLENIRS